MSQIRYGAARICGQCGVGFQPWRKQPSVNRRGLFCSRACSVANALAVKHLDHPQVGANNPCWRGGVSSDNVRYVRRFRLKNPQKVEAGRLLRAAVKAGRLQRPETCSECARVCKPHGHHYDYTKPLEVRWLCAQCHVNLHHLKQAS